MSGFFQGLRRLFVGNDQEQSRPAAAAEEKISVLIIDDDRSLLDTMKELLKDAGFNVLASNTGVKGLNILRYAPGQVKVVLLDFNMPEFDGARTLKFIRQLCPQAKVIGVTGFTDQSLPAEYRDGVDGIVHKPFSGSQLIDRIKGLLGGAGGGPVSA